MTQSRTAGPRKTRRSVLIVDKMADRIITVGGILVIAAVLGMMVFLFSQVAPLFKGGSVQSHREYKLKPPAEKMLAISVDEFKSLAVRVGAKGVLTTWHPQTGVPLESIPLDFSGKSVSAFSQAIDSRHLAFGFSDGTVRFGTIEHKTDIISPAALPKGLKKLDARDSTDGRAVYSIVPGNQIRKTWVEFKLDEPIKVSKTGSPIIAIDYRFSRFGERPTQIMAAMDDERVGYLFIVESKLNLFTRKLTRDVRRAELPRLPKQADVRYALVNELASTVYFADRRGKVYRFNTREISQPFLAEAATVVPKGVKLNLFSYLLGESSIVVGGSDGSLNIFFLLRRKDAESRDGYSLVHTRTFEPQPAPIVAFSPCQQGRTFATGDASGDVWIRHGTSVRTLLKLKEEGPEQTRGTGRIALAPRRDGLLTMASDGTTNFWNLTIPHPETSLHTLLGKVWYEGYDRPSYTWQSTGATEAFEPKLSLVPLIFGTVKATLYSLLFAIPIAILAAIFTSEFLQPSIRGRIKPSIEIMASVPSVVLGFVAALVLAPIVETWIAAVLLVFVVLPLSLILAAYLWQLVPPPIAVRLEGVPKFACMCLIVGLSLYGAYALGPTFERLFFDGNFKAWVNGDMGSGTPFWFLLLMPVSAVVVATGASRLFGRTFAKFMKTVAPFTAALMDLGRWLGIAVATIGLSYICALVLHKLGFDPRGGFVGTYVQRNTLIVGFAMGFAVIPIIYTLAEDSLNAVPDHLRSASLGCGATPWQTALWVVLPTAISGVFSAVMIGMGRAVGETMIVVMSAGNTPLIDLNIFNGLRALSANIAVELPEAPKDDTLYRVLFLTGLVLFAMTFVINTVAELVRLHFRKRSMQL